MSMLTSSRLRRAAIVVLATILGQDLTPTLAYAQTPVVLVHGRGENGSIWDEVKSDLSSNLNVSFITAQLASESHIADQSSYLRTYYLGGVSPGVSVAVGHSNGGLVSRDAARSFAFKGIVTLGTPHHGVPLISELVPAYNYFVYWINSATYLLSAAFWPRCDYFDSPCSYAFIIWTWITENLGGPALAAQLVENQIPSAELQADETPGSMYLTGGSGLNSSTNLANEAASLPNRVGLVVTTENYHVGGPIRLLLDPTETSAAAGALEAVGWAAWAQAQVFDQEADAMWWDYVFGGGMDWYKYDNDRNLADAFFNVAFYTLNYEYACDVPPESESA